MKKLAVLLALLIVVSATPLIASAGSFVTYEDKYLSEELHRFTFEHPKELHFNARAKNWVAFETDLKGKCVELDIVLDYKWAVWMKKYTDAENFDEYVEIYFEDCGWTGGERSTEMVAGHRAIVYEGPPGMWSEYGAEWCKCYAVLHNDCFYTIQFLIYEEEGFDGLIAEFLDPVIESFRFLDVSEPTPTPIPEPTPKITYSFSIDSRTGPTWTSYEGVSGGVGLFDTGIHVNSGDRIIIIANGSFWNGEVTVPNPDGFPDPPDPVYGETILPTIASNSLVGGIGQTTDEYFEALLDSGGTGVCGLGFVGSSFSGTAPISGTLFLAINDRPLGDNMGFLDVQVGGGPIPTPEPTPTPTPVPQSITDARRALYQNYGKCLNEYYWVERGNEMGMMFGDDFERSFTTPLGILETGAKEIIIGAYSSVETLTKAVTSGAGALNCWRMSAVLQLSKPTSLEWEEPEQIMLHILELIEEEKYEEAREEICNIRSVLTVWRDNVDTVGWTNVGITETEGEANKKRGKNLLTAIIKFLDTEYAILGGEVIPSPTPTPTPEGSGFETVFAIAGLLAMAHLLRRMR